MFLCHMEETNEFKQRYDTSDYHSSNGLPYEVLVSLSRLTQKATTELEKILAEMAMEKYAANHISPMLTLLRER